jgi:hypothetical protein
MGYCPVSACCKYNSQTQIALHQPQRALRGLSVAVSGDMNWHGAKARKELIHIPAAVVSENSGSFATLAAVTYT